MSLNVIERIREIGVLRAIGASNGVLYRIVIGEGVAISLASAVMGIVLALPLGDWLSNAVGMTFLRIPLHYHVALDGAFIWLAVAAGIGIVASLLPARAAIGLTVRDTLAYDG
ncbi:ABC transporter permease [Roseiflexus castenholzii]|uniref:ABC transporter permease n=1 Tax=Roseiflexus castenholzii TaxID=120962 RepID=UPI0018DBE77C|nr:FtsX-like permease family protein [Roseiflexus castenholzii]